MLLLSHNVYPGIRDITAYRLAGGEEVSGDVTVEDEWGGVITCPR